MNVTTYSYSLAEAPKRNVTQQELLSAVNFIYKHVYTEQKKFIVSLSNKVEAAQVNTKQVGWCIS